VSFSQARQTYEDMDVDDIFLIFFLVGIQHSLLIHGSAISKTKNLSQTHGTPLSTSQTVERPKFRQAHSRPLHEDAFEAATLFVKGLEAELSKPLKEQGASEDSEEESAEGLTFRLERALDLAIGVSPQKNSRLIFDNAETLSSFFLQCICI
jgi:hypothetical protein